MMDRAAYLAGYRSGMVKNAADAEALLKNAGWGEDIAKGFQEFSKNPSEWLKVPENMELAKTLGLGLGGAALGGMMGGVPGGLVGAVGLPWLAGGKLPSFLRVPYDAAMTGLTRSGERAAGKLLGGAGGAVAGWRGSSSLLKSVPWFASMHPWLRVPLTLGTAYQSAKALGRVGSGIGADIASLSPEYLFSFMKGK